jgi:hypothetical protein
LNFKTGNNPCLIPVCNNNNNNHNNNNLYWSKYLGRLWWGNS